MRLYSHPLSPFAMKARLALFEKNLNFETVHVPWSRAKGFDKPSEMLAINPKGQVPTMVDDDIALYDSTIIFEYLEERYPEPHLYPTEQADRVACRLLEDYADHVIVSEIPRLRTEVFFKDQSGRERPVRNCLCRSRYSQGIRPARKAIDF